MHRVLTGGGRLAVSVWSRIEGSPGMAAQVEGLERHVGSEAALSRRAPFAPGDADELRRLVAGAGFRQVQIRTLREVTRFPSPVALVEAQLAATPLSTLGVLPEDVRRAVTRDVRAVLQVYPRCGELVVPMEAHIALARKEAPSGQISLRHPDSSADLVDRSVALPDLGDNTTG